MIQKEILRFELAGDDVERILFDHMRTIIPEGYSCMRMETANNEPIPDISIESTRSTTDEQTGGEDES